MIILLVQSDLVFQKVIDIWANKNTQVVQVLDGIKTCNQIKSNEGAEIKFHLHENMINKMVFTILTGSGDF